MATPAAERIGEILRRHADEIRDEHQFPEHVKVTIVVRDTSGPKHTICSNDDLGSVVGALVAAPGAKEVFEVPSRHKKSPVN